MKTLPGIMGLNVYFTSTRFSTKEGASGSAAAARPVKLALPKLVQVVTPAALIPTVCEQTWTDAVAGEEIDPVMS